MTLVMNQILDSKLIENNDEEGKDNNKLIEKQEDEAMVSSSCSFVEVMFSFLSSSPSSVNLESNIWFMTNVIELIHCGQFFSEWGCWWKVQKFSIPISIKFIDALLCRGG